MDWRLIGARNRKKSACGKFAARWAQTTTARCWLCCRSLPLAQSHPCPHLTAPSTTQVAEELSEQPTVGRTYSPRVKEVEHQDCGGSAAAAVRLAWEEGLTLLRSNNGSGYQGVLRDSNTYGLKNPFRVQVRRGGRRVTLGRFASAEEAALCYARFHPSQAVAVPGGLGSEPPVVPPEGAEPPVAPKPPKPPKWSRQVSDPPLPERDAATTDLKLWGGAHAAGWRVREAWPNAVRRRASLPAHAPPPAHAEHPPDTVPRPGVPQAKHGHWAYISPPDCPLAGAAYSSCASAAEAWLRRGQPSVQKPPPPPQFTVRDEPWSKEEDEKILALVRTHGRKWRLIGAEMPHRSCDALRNRYDRLSLSDGRKAEQQQQPAAQQPVRNAVVEAFVSPPPANMAPPHPRSFERAAAAVLSPPQPSTSERKALLDCLNASPATALPPAPPSAPPSAPPPAPPPPAQPAGHWLLAAVATRQASASEEEEGAEAAPEEEKENAAPEEKPAEEKPAEGEEEVGAAPEGPPPCKKRRVAVPGEASSSGEHTPSPSARLPPGSRGSDGRGEAERRAQPFQSPPLAATGCGNKRTSRNPDALPPTPEGGGLAPAAAAAGLTFSSEAERAGYQRHCALWQEQRCAYMSHDA